MFFPARNVQSSSQSEINATVRYLSSEFDIENPQPVSISPATTPSSQLRAPHETALIHQRERPATPAVAALVCPVPQRGRTLLTRGQAQSEQTSASVERGPGLTSVPAAEGCSMRDLSLTPDWVPDTMTVGVCALASVGGLIGGLCAAYIKK